MQEATGVRYSEKASTSHAFALVVEGYNALVQDDLTEQFGKGLLWDDRVLYYEDKGEIVSVLVYRFSPSKAAYVVQLCYTEPSSQKKGHMRKLWKAMLDKADKDYDREPVDRVQIQVMSDDANTMAIMGRLNLEKTAITYTQELPL